MKKDQEKGRFGLGRKIGVLCVSISLLLVCSVSSFLTVSGQIQPTWRFSRDLPRYDRFFSMAMSPNGSHIVTGVQGSESEGQLYLLETETQRVLAERPSGGYIEVIDTDSESNRIFVLIERNGRSEVQAYYSQNLSLSSSLSVSGSPEDLDVSGNGSRIVVSSEDGLYVIDATHELVHLWETNAEDGRVSISDNGQLFSACGYTSGFRAYSADGVFREVYSFSPGRMCRRVAVSGDGSYVAVAGGDDGGGDDHHLTLISSDSWNVVWQSDDIVGPVYGLDISHNGEFVITGAINSYGAFLFRRDSNEALWNKRGFGGDIFSVDMTPDGRYFAVGGDDKVGFYENKDGKVRTIWTYAIDHVTWEIEVTDDGDLVSLVGEEYGENVVLVFEGAGYQAPVSYPWLEVGLGLALGIAVASLVLLWRRTKRELA